MVIYYNMDQTQSFFELAEEGSITEFKPSYTQDFRVYVEKSIRSSDSANSEAIKSASNFIINC